MESPGYFIFLLIAVFIAITFGVLIGFGVVPLIVLLFKSNGRRIKLPLWPKIVIAVISIVIAMYYMAVYFVDK